MKRLMDILVSGIVLLLAAPLMLVLGVLVRTKHGKPAIFRQVRPGYKGKPFCMFKFRTMVDRYDAEGRMLPDGERITRLGQFMRSSSLDELPEFFNVLRGEMSLVGPRPLLIQYLERYSPEQMRRHEVHPGITGWAQVNGRNAITWDEKFRLDLWYVEHRSFWLDIKILFLTLWKAIRREGISQPGHATMEEFMGNAEEGGEGEM